MQSWEWRIARDDAGEYRFSPVAVHEAAVVTAEVLLAFDVSRPTIIAELEKKFGMTPAEAGEVLHEARRRVGPTDAGGKVVEVALELVLRVGRFHGGQRQRGLLTLGRDQLGTARRAEPGVGRILMAAAGAQHAPQAIGAAQTLTMRASTSTKG